jgi:hypothetical protein
MGQVVRISLGEELYYKLAEVKITEEEEDL